MTLVRDFNSSFLLPSHEVAGARNVAGWQAVERTPKPLGFFAFPPGFLGRKSEIGSLSRNPGR